MIWLNRVLLVNKFFNTKQKNVIVNTYYTYLLFDSYKKAKDIAIDELCVIVRKMK